MNKVKDPAIIWYPRHVRTVVNKAKTKELKKVCTNTKRAKELIYLMSAQFIRSYHLAHEKVDCIKININSTVLKRVVCSNYKPVLDFLIEKNIIYFNSSYRADYYSRCYWFSSDTIRKNLTTTKLTDVYILKKLTKNHENILKKAKSNTIASYLFDVYNYIKLPNEEELLKLGKSMVKAKQKNKKGKIYKIRGKKSKQKFLNRNDVRCIEDDIQLFSSLTKHGLSIPRVGGYKSGGRVTCTIALTPSWIREQIKIDNQETIEVDFSTLHPNLANKLWGEGSNTITHDEVAKELKMSRNEIKVKHLSFFNFDYYSFKNSELSNFYKEKYSDMYYTVLNIKNDDFKNDKKNTISYCLFAEEVKLMTKVIEEFKKLNIKALYIYDAMRVKKSDLKKAKEIMNNVALKMNILSRAA